MTLETKPSLSLSEMAVQMENLLHTLIPFKRASLSELETSKALDLEQTAAWWDTIIDNARQELAILNDHAAALGIAIEPPPKKTATEVHLGLETLPLEAPGLDDDPFIATKLAEAQRS